MTDAIGDQNQLRAPDDGDLEARLDLYATLFAKLNQEGDGIWNRFNVLAGINLALFGAFAYICLAERRSPVWREVALGIAMAGVFAAAWSSYVLRHLWEWHLHWARLLKKMEGGFPQRSGWLRPHDELSRRQKTDLGISRAWLPYFTQPFFVLFAIAWGLLLLLLGPAADLIGL